MEAVSERSAGRRRTRGRPLPGESVGPDVILRAARSTFAKRGYDATSVREIARELGVDAALIAHHFGSKVTLWNAVVDQIAELMAPLFAAVDALRVSPLTYRARVERAVALGVDTVFAEPDIGMFFSTAATEEGERYDRLMVLLVRPYYAVTMRLLNDAAEAGEIQATDPGLLFFMIENAIGTTVSYSHLMREFTTLPARPDAFKQAVLETAFNMLGPCRPASR
ncbi:TetR family transcriptional regulator [Burkholderia sp. 4701]|nr:TetR family transcriptional regulator [Burkholderia sp. 4701]MXN83966.1 TetR family transcriptional regulator [Burkholderia sp. 4812]